MLNWSYRVLTVLLFIVMNVPYTSGQKHHERFDKIDVQHYVFDITLSDDSDKIVVDALVKIRFRKPVEAFDLDLVRKDASGKGMSVLSLTEGGKSVTFNHTSNTIELQIPVTQTGEIREYGIRYEGVPADGLIISKSKYGERTFFGDNWPDRAKNWLPVVDHPSDKSTVEWIITTPVQYQSIANGMKMEDTNISPTQITTRWQTVDPIPTKVMVLGAARFAVQHQGTISGVPISSWVYPQDRDKGFHDYALASPIMDYFIGHIGPYPFQKLANVQSKTRFGGMENAGNIFYSERSVDGVRGAEALIAHEVAHQWFGNSASELNWHHVWLSEGFATYCTNLYIENKYGRDRFVEREKTQREEIIMFSKRSLVPVVNPQVTDYMKLLNANSYQKGGWVLHMLRRELGDDIFWEGIRQYYRKFKFSNALTEDFQQVMEDVSGKDLENFFRQWIYTAGQPNLKVDWKKTSEELVLDIDQVQKSATFSVPLEVKIIFEDGSSKIETVQISQKSQEVKLAIEKPVTSIELDPNTWLLFEVSSMKQQ